MSEDPARQPESDPTDNPRPKQQRAEDARGGSQAGSGDSHAGQRADSPSRSSHASSSKSKSGSSSGSGSRSKSSKSSKSKHGHGRKVRVTSPEESQLEQHELAKHQSQRKKRNSGGGGGGVGQLNLTSMIDVIFLLLIYFVVTANFVQNEGVLVAKLPQGTGKQKASDLPKNNIDIYLTSVGKTEVAIEVHSKRFTNFTNLANYLAGIQANPKEGRSGTFPPDNPIIIHPGGQVRWQHVVQAFNATVKTDYTAVSFAQSTGSAKG